MEVDIMQKYNNKRSELIVAIHDMSSDDLEQIVEAVKLRRTYLHNVATKSFTPGG